MIMEQSLMTTQEQLSARVADVVRFEQQNRKLQTELKTMKERNESYEEEIGEQKSSIEKLRRDLLSSKEETHRAIQEGMAFKQQASKLEVEIEGHREQEKMLNEQVRYILIKYTVLFMCTSVKNSKYVRFLCVILHCRVEKAAMNY